MREGEYGPTPKSRTDAPQGEHYRPKYSSQGSQEGSQVLCNADKQKQETYIYCIAFSKKLNCILVNFISVATSLSSQMLTIDGTWHFGQVFFSVWPVQ